MTKKYRDDIPLPSFEGFYRQLFWREYQRYCYIYVDWGKYLEEPYFPLTNKLEDKWYYGATNIPLLNDIICKAFKNAYLHHIERLMVVGNLMMLHEIDPRDGFRWFMEFSIDSYDWVMYQNVYDMVFHITGGETMTRPYITSSNYLTKMSNYKGGMWENVVTNKYHQFLEKYKDKLWKYRYFFRGLKKD